jgi:hypothetical protein
MRALFFGWCTSMSLSVLRVFPGFLFGIRPLGKFGSLLKRCLLLLYAVMVTLALLQMCTNCLTPFVGEFAELFDVDGLLVFRCAIFFFFCHFTTPYVCS